MRTALMFALVAMVSMSTACDPGDAAPAEPAVCVYIVPDWVNFIERGERCECTFVAEEDTCGSVCTISWIIGEDGSGSFPGTCEGVACCTGAI